MGGRAQIWKPAQECRPGQTPGLHISVPLGSPAQHRPLRSKHLGAHPSVGGAPGLPCPGTGATCPLPSAPRPVALSGARQEGGEILPQGLREGKNGASAGRNAERGGGCPPCGWAALRRPACWGALGVLGGTGRAGPGGWLCRAVALCVVCTSPFLQRAAGVSLSARCCGQRAGGQPSGRHLWALNSPLSYAPQTMGPFLHKMGMRDPVMGL